MIGNSREAIIQEDTVIKGEIRNCRRIEIRGYVEGNLAAENVVVREGGKMYGTLKAGAAEIQGVLQGDAFVKNLFKIASSGVVNGNIQYGQIAMELGGELSAKLRNVPPEIAGDLELTVGKGQSVGITLVDLNALDPDDKAKDLVFAVSKPTNGFVAMAAAPKKAVKAFTQADLEAGKVLFVHDGSDTKMGSFDVVVSDAKGATSGSPKTITAFVRNARPGNAKRK